MEGTILEQSQGKLLLKVGAIAYEIHLSTKIDKKEGDPCQLFLHTYLRENVLALYGFETMQQKRFFELLLQVSGVGPKLALSILGQSDLLQFAEWIHQQDVKALTQIKGLGKKGAERLILELKDKTQTMYQEEKNDPSFVKKVKQEASTEMVQTLMMLGYSVKEAELYAENYQSDLSLEENLKLCFKTIAERKWKG